MGSVEEVEVYAPGDRDDGWISLLASNQYEQVTDCVREAYRLAIAEGETEQAALLAAARHLCASCIEIQNEVTFHRQAYKNSEQRREKLVAELQKIFQLIEIRQETAVSTTKPLPRTDVPQQEPLNIPDAVPSKISLWQRIQRFFGWQSNSKMQEEEEPELKTAVPLDNALSAPPFILHDHAESFAPALDSTLFTENKGADIKIGATAKPMPAKDEKPYQANLVVYCLGVFRVYQNDLLLIDWNGLKGQMILKYLVAHHDKPVGKDVLMDVFWPDADPEAARRNLHQAVYSLRQTLKEREPDFQHILFENDCYFFNPELDIWLDFREFEKSVQAGRRLEKVGLLSEAVVEYGVAVGLYEGKFLEEDLYTEWPRMLRETLQNLYLEISIQLSEHYLKQGEYTAAITLYQKILVRDHCCEEAYRGLMNCYLAQGQRHLAVRCFYNCQEVLKTDLDLPPSPETLALYRQLKSIA